MKRALLVCLLLTAAFAQQPPSPQPPPAAPGFDMIWGLKVPLRDGVRLNATVYRPNRQAGPLPVIFTLTPYIADTYQERAQFFAQNGYVYALVDVRGRGNSEGKFEPFANEARDGHDVVEFLARQPWSNGKITMWGGSYAGYDQWATLKELPPHLATIVPAAAAQPSVDFPFFKNIWSSYDIQWLTFTSGVTPNNNLFGNAGFWTGKFKEMYDHHLPFRALEEIVGNPSTAWKLWMQHPTPDAYWLAMNPTPEQYAKMSIPILTITGHYDGDQRGALRFYRDHMRYGAAAAKQQHYLIIGPWDHAGTRTPRTEVGGVQFSEKSKLDLNQLHKAWYDWTLKGGPKPDFLKKRVAYYVPGPDLAKEEWKYADALDQIAGEIRVLYLGSDGHANDAFHSGTLHEDPPPYQSATDQWTYDPLNLAPGEREREEVKDYLLDQREAMNLYGEGVIYHSEPFPADTEITGELKLTLWLAMDVPDTDLLVQVYEVMPNGRSLGLTDDMLRASYRDSLTERKPVPAGEPVKYEFNAFQWFSRKVARGSRLRLIVKSPNSIQLEKNYNAGGAVEDQTARDARTAHLTVLHDATHPSALELPIVK